MKKCVYLTALLAALCVPVSAFAEGETECEGENLNVAFSDGNNVSEICVNHGSGMEASVGDDSFDGTPDEGNYD